MKMIKTLFLTCFFILTFSLTACLTTEEAAEAIDSTTDNFSSDSFFSWGGGSFGGNGLGDFEGILNN